MQMIEKLFFTQPDQLPTPECLGERIIVLDVSFALPVAPGDYPLEHPKTQEFYQTVFENTTLQFIEKLGKRLVLWVDHHPHRDWERFQNEARFHLRSSAEVRCCMQLVTPELLATYDLGQVDSLVCHPDLDGLLSAARLILGGKSPYPRAIEDAIAADTRRSKLSDWGQRIDRAIKTQPTQETYQAVLSWLVGGDNEARLLIEQVARDYVQLAEPAGRAWLVGSCKIQDARTVSGPFDRTLALQRLQSGGYFGLLLYKRNGAKCLEIASERPEVSLPEWLGKPGGSNQRLTLDANHLAEAVERLNARVPEDQPLARPKRAMLEITRRCNLRCPLCPVGNGQAVPMPDLDKETFQTVVATYGSTLQSLTLHNYGEPTLHPRLSDFIQCAKQTGIPWVDLSTNGTLISEQLAVRLVDSGLDAIRFSVDTTDAKAYAKYRRGGKLSQVLANILELRRVRDAAGKAQPLIEAQALVMRKNEAALAEFEQVMLANGADQVRFKTLNIFMSGEKMASQGVAILPTNPSYHRYVSANPQPASRDDQIRGCHWPWDRLVILSNGVIVPCCHDYNADYPLGLAKEGDWDTSARRRFMLDRLLRPSTIEMCRRCAEAVEEIGLRKEADFNRSGTQR